MLMLCLCLCFHWLLVQDDYGDSCSGAYCHHSRRYLQKNELVMSHVHIHDSASFKVVHQSLMPWALYLSHVSGLQQLALIGSSSSFCCGGVGIESEDSPSELMTGRSYESRGLSRKVLVPWGHVSWCTLIKALAYGI